MRSEIKVMAYLESSKRSLSGLEPGAYCVLIWLGVSQGERERELWSLLMKALSPSGRPHLKDLL